MRLDQFPLSVTLLHVDGLPVGGVAEDAVAGAAHADVAVHGHGLALHAHRVVDLQPLRPVRVEAVLVGLVHLEMPAVPATHKLRVEAVLVGLVHLEMHAVPATHKLRVEAVLVGLVHLEIPAVPTTHKLARYRVCVCVGGGRGAKIVL